MRGALAAVAALALSGCWARPWTIDETERIDQLLAYEVDDADQAALDGLPVPHDASSRASEYVPMSAPIGMGQGRRGPSGGRGGSKSSSSTGISFPSLPAPKAAKSR
jgi:hypothetical protein